MMTPNLTSIRRRGLVTEIVNARSAEEKPPSPGQESRIRALAGVWVAVVRDAARRLEMMLPRIMSWQQPPASCNES